MSTFFFVSDLHGRTSRYETLWRRMIAERPAAVLLGGDLLPHRAVGWTRPGEPDADFLMCFIVPGFREVRRLLGDEYPTICIILGNDDARAEEARFRAVAEDGLWRYLNCETATVAGFTFVGYPFVPPSPFLLKDWERYDTDWSVRPGCISPEAGRRTLDIPTDDIRSRTIACDIAALFTPGELPRTIWLFHAPPYNTILDRAGLDGRAVDGAPLDIHVGSPAIRQFIDEKQPLLTLHGHIHEAPRLTGRWQTTLGRTIALTAAHDGPELALVRIDPERPETATRQLL